MTAALIAGTPPPQSTRTDAAGRPQALKARGIQPHLAIVLVGDDPASQVYVKHKVNDSSETGLKATLERHPADLAEAELLARIHALNADPSVHGILVQLPLPKHMDAHKVIEAISPAKDVDGFHVASAGALMVGQPGFWPCTPHGRLRMLEAIGYSPRRKHAVAVCHSAPPDLAAFTRQADVIVAAVGKQNLVTADMVKPGAVVIDVGMNRNAEGKLCGDVDFEGVKQVAGWITPVPGGVGPMTITMLLVNTLEAAERL